MQEMRFVIDEIAPNRDYPHRLMYYNNDPTTTFADIQKVLGLLEARIAKRLTEEPSKATQARPSVTKADLQILKRAREILDSSSKWDRASTQSCTADAKTFGLYCAFELAAKEVNGTSDDGVAIQEARSIISEMDPNRTKYKARLVDFNNDPTITFADIQKLFQLVEGRISKRMADEAAVRK